MAMKRGGADKMPLYLVFKAAPASSPSQFYALIIIFVVMIITIMITIITK